MAETKKGIQDLTVKAKDAEGNEIEVAPGAVTSVTTETPHPADESSQPGPYDGLELDRPPVSTNNPETPIAHSLVGGAGAPTGPPEIHPETHVASNAYVTSADRENVREAAGAEPAETPRRGPGRPRSEG